MKEFVNKLIGRLEEKENEAVLKAPNTSEIANIEYQKWMMKSYGFKESIEIVKELAEEYRNDKVCQTAIMYAKNLHKYGVQIDSIWETATQQSMALKQAYMRGRQDERDIFDEWQEKHINTSTDTSTDASSGWISVKDGLPTKEGSYLVVGKTGGATVTRWYMPNKFHPQGHFGGNSAEYIRYWMPRPQAPYKEGE